MSLNIKEQQIKKAAFLLFNKYGIKKVSVEEICKSSATSKPTFYKFFPNKKYLAKTLINELINEKLNSYKKIFISDQSLEKQFKEFFKLEIKVSKLISRDFFNDLIQYFPHDDFAKQKEDIVTLFINQIKKKNTDNIQKYNVSIDFIIHMLKNDFFNIHINPSFISMYKDLESATTELAHFISYGLFGKESDK